MGPTIRHQDRDPLASRSRHSPDLHPGILLDQPGTINGLGIFHQSFLNFERPVRREALG